MTLMACSLTSIVDKTFVAEYKLDNIERSIFVKQYIREQFSNLLNPSFRKKINRNGSTRK